MPTANQAQDAKPQVEAKGAQEVKPKAKAETQEAVDHIGVKTAQDYPFDPNIGPSELAYRQRQVQISEAKLRRLVSSQANAAKKAEAAKAGDDNA